MQIKLTNDIYYVGVNDRRTDMFENHMALPKGVSYNSYLIVDEKIALIDPVEAGFVDECLHKIKAVIGERAIDYLIINHDEPDHSGSIRAFVNEYPNVQIIGNNKTFAPLENFYGNINNKNIVAEADTLSLGKHTLQFFMVPMVHWPESMVTYDILNKIAFTNDAFGGFGTLDGAYFDDEANLDFYEDEMRRYYANIVGKVSVMAAKAIQKLSGLEVKMIAPSHGLIWRTNLAWVLEKYSQWSSHQSENGVVIVYGSMYGNTARMADIVARGVAEGGIKNIRIYDVARTETSFIISDIWKYKGVIIGGSSHYGSIFPNSTLLLHELQEFNPQNKVLGLFSSGSWNCSSLKYLKEFADKVKWDLAAEPVKIMGAPIRTDDIDNLFALGKAVADKLNNY